MTPATWSAFGVWSAGGLVVYFGYGRRRSELARSRSGPEQPAQGE
ncbi:amino acid permease C-terminal domain-containing protein [Saccharothrix sp. ALI-22-I]